MENISTNTAPLAQAQIEPQTPSGDVIQIGLLESVLGVVAIVVSAGIAYGTLRSTVNSIKETLTDNVVPDLQDVRERFRFVEDRVDTLWKDKYAPSRSPRKLNDFGQNVLDQSGVKKVIDKKKDHLLKLVKEKKPKTAYDAENYIEEVVMELPKHCPDIIEDLKNGAFRTGSDISAVLFVGSIYLRDEIFPDLGFKLSELDN